MKFKFILMLFLLISIPMNVYSDDCPVSNNNICLIENNKCVSQPTQLNLSDTNISNYEIINSSPSVGGCTNCCRIKCANNATFTNGNCYCNSGYYQNGDVCKRCSTETNSKYPFSAVGSTSIDNCYLTLNAGKYVAEAGGGPIDCDMGYKCVGGDTIYYGGTTTTGGMTACNQGNEYQDKTGQSTCEICPGEGIYKGDDRTLGLEQCWKALEWGNATNGGRIDCYHSLKQDVASGTYNGEDNDNGCDSWEAKCEAGKYYNHQVEGSCEACEAGYYCEGYDGSGSKVNFGTGYGLTPCPVGNTSEGGSTVITNCYMRGGTKEDCNSNGNCTKFCDTVGCFYLPVSVSYQ
jgi:hypothetical protein